MKAYEKLINKEYNKLDKPAPSMLQSIKWKFWANQRKESKMEKINKANKEAQRFAAFAFLVTACTYAGHVYFNDPVATVMTSVIALIAVSKLNKV